MRYYNLLLFILVTMATAQSLSAQNIDCTRSSTLVDGDYEMEGTAYLERFDDGTLQLRLGDDFKTERGPDVQIFLSSDRTSIAGALKIEDIGPGDGINHFEGAITFDVPGNPDIDQYPFIVFRCFAFRAHWGGGEFEESSCAGSNGGGETPVDTMVTSSCIESITATTNWVTEVTVCPNDGIDDVVSLMNNAFIPAGATYAYVFADDNNRITNVHFEDSFNFEGSNLETANIFGISYEGMLSYNIGDPMTSITADGCSILSSPATFLKVFKENCGATFDCLESATATTAWATTVEICPNDGESDVVPLLNNVGAEPTDGHYSFIITDESDNIMVVHNSSSYDFEGSGLQTQRVYGVSFDENLSAIVGQNISTITADGCAILSDTENLFLTVLKNACAAPPSNNLTITGRITAPSRGGIQGVVVALNNGSSTVTNADGVYTFGNLPAGTYTVTPSVTTGVGNGLSSTDLVLTARHILGLTFFDNVYQIISADANNNNSVSAVDLVQMRLIILGRSDTFAGNTSWRFLDIPDNLTGTTLPEVMNDTRTIIISESDVTDANFTGIKIGDLNGNASLDLR